MTTTTYERFITIEEAAIHLSTKKGWIYQNHERYGIPSYTLGRRLLFKISDLDIWMETRKKNISNY
jgi:excisionase family DNA binding protein